MSVGFYPARDYLPLLEFGVVRRDGWPKTIIPSDDQFDAMAKGLPKLRDMMCSGGEPASGTEWNNGAFRMTRIWWMAGLYIDSQYISLTVTQNDLSRIFNVVQ